MELEYMRCCCGLAEFYGINESDWTVTGMLEFIAKGNGALNVPTSARDSGHASEYANCSHICFTLAHEYGLSHANKQRLAHLQRYVHRYWLGDLVRTTLSRNPSSGNIIEGALFTPDWNALTEWYQKRYPKTYAAQQESHRRERERWAVDAAAQF